jgi:hypothetical protein
MCKRLSHRIKSKHPLRGRYPAGIQLFCGVAYLCGKLRHELRISGLGVRIPSGASFCYPIFRLTNRLGSLTGQSYAHFRTLSVLTRAKSSLDIRKLNVFAGVLTACVRGMSAKQPNLSARREYQIPNAAKWGPVVHS